MAGDFPCDFETYLNTHLADHHFVKDQSLYE